MKKSFSILTIAALLCILILASCNIDATIGIYSEVSTSTPNKNVTLVNYIGQDSSDRYYYQLDDGVYRTEYGALLKSTKDSRVIGSSLDGDNLYVMKENIAENVANSTVEIYRYTDPTNLSTGTKVTFEAEPAEGERLTRLFTNGIVLSNMNVYRLSGTDLHKIDVGISNGKVIYGIESEDYAFIRIYNNDAEAAKYFVVDNSSDTLHVNIDADTKTYSGFQYFSADPEFVLFYRDNSSNKSYATKLNAGGISESPVLLKSSLTKSTTYNASFLNPADTNQVIVKCNNYFDVIDFSEGTVTPVNKGYAADICTADVSNFKVVEGTHKVVVGTVSSLLYLIDMDDTSKTPVEI
ncbi:MAG: hypothetical protein J5800_02720 [Spirochaetales bacterium]|nr:hypothetical protein [Spirochaetales bacterium]